MNSQDQQDAVLDHLRAHPDGASMRELMAVADATDDKEVRTAIDSLRYSSHRYNIVNSGRCCFRLDPGTWVKKSRR